VQNRTRFTLEVVRAVRKVWPASKPLFLRLSSSDWVEGGTTIEDTVRLAKLVKAEGVDLVDCSSGGQRYHKRTRLAHDTLDKC
jgi:2,4-dienoyl-CoA reductase-like NADH-dependent reductase (Old Yellow Enzyme family)